MEQSGFLVKNTHTTFYAYLEFVRIFVLLICSYSYHDPSFPYFQVMILIKFWIVIIAARVSETWMIKYEFQYFK